jgi:hypothetical protein
VHVPCLDLTSTGKGANTEHTVSAFVHIIAEWAMCA